MTNAADLLYKDLVEELRPRLGFSNTEIKDDAFKTSPPETRCL